MGKCVPNNLKNFICFFILWQNSKILQEGSPKNDLAWICWWCFESLMDRLFNLRFLKLNFLTTVYVIMVLLLEFKSNTLFAYNLDGWHKWKKQNQKDSNDLVTWIGECCCGINSLTPGIIEEKTFLLLVYCLEGSKWALGYNWHPSLVPLVLCSVKSWCLSPSRISFYSVTFINLLQ